MANGDLMPNMPPGTNIFREIGLGTDTGAAGAPEQGRAEIETILEQLRQGDTANLIKAQQQINNLVKQRVESQKPFPQAPMPAGPPRPQPKPAQPTPAPAPAAQPAPTPQAPQAPQAGQPQQPKSVLADLTGLVREAAKIGQPIQQAGRPSQNVGATQTTSPVPGRRPM